jgi:hypothetical protein
VACRDEVSAVLKLRCQFGTRLLEHLGMRSWRYSLASGVGRFIARSNVRDMLALGPEGTSIHTVNRNRKEPQLMFRSGPFLA